MYGGGGRDGLVDEHMREISLTLFNHYRRQKETFYGSFVPRVKFTELCLSPCIP